MNIATNKPLIRLLLVEDDQVDRLTCKRALEKNIDCDFMFFEAETGTQGIELAHSKQPDCILLDQNLPDFNGVEFLAELAGDSGKQPIPVVMLTGADNAMLAVEALKMGAYDYVVKGSEREPLQWLPSVVLRTIREHQSILEKTQAEQELANYRQHLEELVALRTEQLEQQNKTLNATNIKLSQALNELKQNESALRIAAAAFDIQEGLFVTDSDNIIQRVNQAFTRITGYSPEEAIGRAASFLRSDKHNKAFYDVKWDEIRQFGYWQGEIWDKRKNGEVFPIWLTITAVSDADGQISHYVGSFSDITAIKQAEKILLEARERLENQVANTQEELEKTRQETNETNTALNVILRLRDKDKDNAQVALSNEVETTIIPLLKKLKGPNNHQQTQRTIALIEDNLKQLMQTYGRANHLDGALQKLTPIEKQVASMVKLGNPTKVIATTLNISGGTVNLHRKHIRKKLGLDSKANLQNYLQSLSE